MKIVVTGVDGVVGRGVAERLLGLGHDVVGAGDRRPVSWPGSVEFVAPQRCDPSGAEAVVHCARDDALLATLIATSAGRLVVASSVRHAEPPPPFDGLHVRAAMVLGRNVDEATLRAFTGPVVVDAAGVCDRPLQVVHPHDLARVLVRAALDTDLLGTIDVAADGQTSIRAIAAALGRPVLRLPARLPARLRRVVPDGLVTRELPRLDPGRLREQWGVTHAHDAAQCVADFALAARGRIAV